MSTAIKMKVANPETIISDAQIEKDTLRNPIQVRKGSILRRYRMEAGLTQKVVANKIGVSSNWISCVENGRTNPVDIFVEGLVYELDHNMTEFWTEVEESAMRKSECFHCNYSFGNPHACVDSLVKKKIYSKHGLHVVKGKKKHGKHK